MKIRLFCGRVCVGRCQMEFDDEPNLSTEAYEALQEFYRKDDLKNCRQISYERNIMPGEDWQLSQFWYDDVTSKLLAEEALAVVGVQGRIACVSCPSVFTMIKKISPHHSINGCCFEYDRRFEVLFNENFIFYDYKEPLNLSKELQNSFDLVILDPPFLSRECLEKCTQTTKFLTKEKIILCTGAVMEEVAVELLQVTKCDFIPMHCNKLANEFSCYTNYKTMILDNR